jgi:hypothetical protein
VREVENRLLGVETNITNWQRRQNSNNNFSAVVPYDMELQRKESKEFLDDLTTRDQRMMFAVITMVITAEPRNSLKATPTSSSPRPQAYVPDGDAEIPADGRAQHRASHRPAEDQRLPHPYHGEPRRVYAFKVQEIMDHAASISVRMRSPTTHHVQQGKLMNQSAFLLGVPAPASRSPQRSSSPS